MDSRNKSGMTYERKTGNNYVKITGQPKDIARLAWFDRIMSAISAFTLFTALHSFLPGTFLSWWKRLISKD